MRTLFLPSILFALLLLPLSAGPAVGQVKTFMVTVEKKTSEHPYYQEGDDDGYVIDGTQGKEITLEKEKTYDFEIGSGVGNLHPFYISTSPVGAGAGTYSNGVTNNEATEGETLTFTPLSDAPDSLWYQCDIHRKMGWRMALVVDSARALVDSDGEVGFNGTGVTVSFSGTSGSDSVTVDKFNSAPDGTEGISESTVSQYRFAIEAGGNLSFDSNTEVRFDVGTLTGIGDPSNVTVYKRSNVGSGSFTELSTTYDSDADELVVTTGTLSEFVFASDSEPLPVELAGFDVRTDGRAVQLSWQTVSETGSAGFEVQRTVASSSSVEASWTALGFVESKASGGTTTETIRYRFRDEKVPFEAERVSYRLRQVDTDGTSHLSRTVTVQIDAPSGLALNTPFPNPTTGSARIRYALPSASEVRLALYNTLGKRVATLARGHRPTGRKEIRLETSELSSGTYLLRLSASGQTRTRRLTILR